MQGLLLLLALLSVINAQTPEQRAKKLVSEMAPSEKYRLLNGVGWANYNNDAGYYIGNTVPNPARGIPSINMQDGPQGFRTTNTSQYGQVTSWPCSLNVASTWDGDLMRQWGTAMGKECRAKGANQLLGPAVNFHRVARGGRNGEYVTGEDPHLGSVMSANYVIGVQSQKVMATVKHYMTNNQETNRNSESNVVDERTLHEIYLPAFEAAVNAGVASFMCSYNKINGTYACGNPYTLQTVLRGELGFQGWVMSDWWATHGTWPDRGLDQDMPGNYLDDGSKDYYSPENLAKVPINLIDQAAVRILTSMITIGAFDEPVCNTGNGGCNKYLYQVVATNQEHVALARTIGGASAQLLQNNGVLPLDTLPQNAVIAVVGSACNSAYNLQGMTNQWDLGNYYILGGSGRVINPNTVPILAGISTAANQHGYNVIYDGSDDVQKSIRLLQNAQVGIICGGKWSTEGQDRKDLYVDQDSFISQVLTQRPRNVPMVVALSTPGAVLTDWRGNASAIVNMFLAGEQTGNAWADVLFGHVNPSGRLPVTFPLSESDVIAPCPGESCTYTERLNVGYRGMVGKPVAFPFGHGLTYTQFGYSWVTRPTTSGCKSNQIACMEVMISNNGKRSGNEIPQVYIDFPGAAGEPTGQLRAFEKVFLLPGATANIKFGLTARDLSIWDVTSSASSKWRRIMGKFNVYVGASSRDVRLQGDFTSA